MSTAQEMIANVEKGIADVEKGCDSIKKQLARQEIQLTKLEDVFLDGQIVRFNEPNELNELITEMVLSTLCSDKFADQLPSK